MILPNNFRLDRAADMATFIVKNKADLDSAALKLADTYVEEMGETRAHETVAAALSSGIQASRNWLSIPLTHETRRVVGDLRELVGLPRVAYANTTVEDVIRSAPAEIRPLVRAAAARLPR
jgi:hypothetical protein